MNSNRAFSAKSTKIVFYYLVFIATATLMCARFVGSRTILEYAAEIKPFSFLLAPDSYNELLEKKEAVRIVCLGDSNFFYPAASEHETIAGLLQTELVQKTGNSELVVLQRAWSSADMFAYYCLFYQVSKFSPDLIVVPINWRQFRSPFADRKWRFHGELAAFAPLRAKLPPGYEDPIRSAGISAIGQREYKASLYSLYAAGMKLWMLDKLQTFLGFPVEPRARTISDQDKGGIDQPEELLRIDDLPVGGIEFNKKPDFARKIFQMKITRENKAFQFYRSLAHVAAREEANILFFIWPLNYENLQELEVWDAAAFDRSRRLLSETASEENVPFSDLSLLLDNKYFYDFEAHCIVPGRKKIVEALTPKVLEILNESGVLEAQGASGKEK